MDYSLEMHNELALMVQWQREAEAKRMRRAGTARPPSLWARLMGALQRGTAPAASRQ